MAAPRQLFRSALSWSLQSGEAELGLRLAAAVRHLWIIGGYVREGARWLDELLALSGATGKTILRARALTAAADLVSWKGETEAYLRFAEEAVTRPRRPEWDARRPPSPSACWRSPKATQAGHGSASRTP